MNKIQYLNVNGEFEKADSKVIYINNRAFSYGDGIFETIHANGTKPQFPYEHYQRLKKACEVLKMNVPFDQYGMEEEISRLLNKNRLYKGVRVRLNLFRKEGGLYTPDSADSSFLIQATPLPSEYYKLNNTGLKIDIFREFKKPVNILSGFKTLNAIPFVLAGIYKKEHELDDCIILNDQQHVCEGVSSNVFFVKGKTVITPPLESGCVAGIMRIKVVEIARFLGYEIEKTIVLPEEIDNFEEIFFTNAIQGIRWAGAYKGHRFYSFTVQKICEGLNDIAFMQ